MKRIKSATMMPRNLPRLPKKRRCSHSASPFLFSILCTCKLLIFLLALGERTDTILVRAQTDHSQCYSDLYASDRNGDGRVDAEEYVEFCSLRLEQRLQVYPDGHTYDVSSAGITTFVFLPSGLQSNFYTLACLCSRFDFDDAITDNRSCCVGDNAHLSVLSDANGAQGMEDDEVRYSNIVCTFTDRAIDGVISTMEKLESPPPSIAPVQTTTLIPTTSPTTLEPTNAPTNPPTTSTPTNSPTNPPTTSAPTNTPSSSPSIRTDPPSSTPTTIAPTLSPTTPPSLRTAMPTSIATVTPSVKPATTIAPVAQTVQPTNITVKTSYSILAQEKEQMLKNVVSDSIDGMDILARMVATELWFDEEIILEKSVLHDRLFVELPTSIDKIQEMGFTSTPKLVDMDVDGESEKVFQGGPCPTEMEFGSENSEYKCFNVTASILLRVTFDDYLMEEGMTADDVKELYTDALEQKILRGELATVHEELLPDSTVIMATGQLVSESTNVTKPGMRVGVIVGLATGGLLLILILFYLIILRRKRQKQRGDEKETVANPEEDLEARNSPSSKSSSGNGSPGAARNKNSTFVPYFQNDTSPGASFGAEDTKSIGGISAESDAGWSEAYTSSMGSVSDDGVGDLDSPSRTSSPGRPPMMSLSMGPASVPIETEETSAVSPMKENQVSETASAATPNTPTSPDARTSISPVSPITPKSLQVLEESMSDNDEEILVHEDFSDEEDDGDKKDENESSDKKKETPEEFRARIHDLIERIVPEEIDQIDNMIAEFKNREDELVDTLLAMEKRAIAQKEQIDAAPPSSPEREGSSSN